MKIAMKIIGILIIVFSSLYLLFCLSMVSMAYSYGVEAPLKLLLIPISILAVGIILVVKSSDNDHKRQKRWEQHINQRYTPQEQEIYFRNADAQGKSINEYLMDDRTKLVTYYDRMPSEYKNKLVNYADTLYRNYENEEYLNRK